MKTKEIIARMTISGTTPEIEAARLRVKPVTFRTVMERYCNGKFKNFRGKKTLKIIESVKRFEAQPQ